jgi:acyl carrier protein
MTAAPSLADRIAGLLGIATPSEDARIRDLGVDSLDLMDFWFAAEKEFGIELRDSDLTPATFGDIVTIIREWAERRAAHGQRG